MKYPIAIEPGDKNHAYGVVVPDLPGCYSAGDTLDIAYENAKEAIAGWIEVELDEGHDIPLPSKIEDIAKQKDFKGWIMGVVEIPDDLMSKKAQRVNITLSGRVLLRLDFLAKTSGETRSGYISRMVYQQR